MTDGEVEALGAGGWFVREGFAGAAGAAAVAEGRVDALRPAGLARDHHRDRAVRGDRSMWIDADDAPMAPLFAGFEALRLEVNAGAWLGLTRFELQLARFAGDGSGYAPHRDALVGPHNRRLTAICYLNRQWITTDGGVLELRVDPPVELAPLLGRLVVFLSDRVEHQVLPVFAPRLAATAWYYG
jgi:SM-20-related protein